MRRVALLLGPLSLAVFPVLSLFAQNQTEVELDILTLPLVLCVASALVLFGVGFLITKRAAKASLLASLVLVAFFYYGVFVDQPGGWFAALWLTLFVAGLVALLRTTLDVSNLVVILSVAAVVMAVPQAVSIVRYHADDASASAADPRLWPTELEPPVVASGAQLPDIYVLSPDDYERTDVLQQYFDYDDSPFVAALEERGFVISESGTSPYMDSEANMAALLNMDYLSEFPTVLGEDSQDVRLVQRVSEDNRAARLLTSIGYDYIHLDTDEVTFAGGNPGISPMAAPDSFMNLWLRKSILGQIGGPLGFDQSATNARFRTAVRSEFSELVSLPEGPNPKFVVFHTLLPHDPYLYDAHGEPITYAAHSDLDQSSDAGRAHYLEQLQYTSTRLLDAIDKILATSETPPVIVLQADEGFSSKPEVFGETAMLDIRVKGISAFYLPGVDQPGVPDPPNSVNALRFVFNQVFGTDYEMLDSASYVEGDLPYDFSEEIPVE